MTSLSQGGILRTALACISWPLLLGAGATGAEPRPDPAEAPRYVVGPVNAEDLERLPGTPWLIASGMAAADHPANGITLIDTQHESWQPAWPDRGGLAPARPDPARYPGCAALPNLPRFSPHGIALRVESRYRATLYVVNDGPRARVEIFNVDYAGKTPTLSWTGCVVAPPETSPNAVAALPDGGFLMSSIMSGPAETAVKGLVGGKPTGEVFRWRAGHGFDAVPGSRVNGANGIAVSPDGKTMFLNAWSARQILRIPLAKGGMGRAVLPTDFMPDNIKWVVGNTLVATGQSVTLPVLFAQATAPGRALIVLWTIAVIDPKTMRIARSKAFGVTDSFGGGTTAVRVGDSWWVGSFRADRIAKWRDW